MATVPIDYVTRKTRRALASALQLVEACWKDIPHHEQWRAARGYLIEIIGDIDHLARHAAALYVPGVGHAAREARAINQGGENATRPRTGHVPGAARGEPASLLPAPVPTAKRGLCDARSRDELVIASYLHAEGEGGEAASASLSFCNNSIGQPEKPDKPGIVITEKMMAKAVRAALCALGMKPEKKPRKKSGLPKCQAAYKPEKCRMKSSQPTWRKSAEREAKP